MKRFLKLNSNGKKMFLVLVSMTILLTAGVAGTLAYLFDVSETVENTMIPGSVPPTVVEVIDGNVKEEVSIENSGNVDAYIRASIIVTWMNDERNLYGKAPVLDTDYEMKVPASNSWKMGKDGYYYYTEIVEPETTTKPLIENASVITGTAPEGYELSMEIVAQTIQAGGTDDNDVEPVVLAWGSAQGGSVLGVNPNKTLKIDEAD